MSMSALLLAVRSRLRAATTATGGGLAYEQTECDVGWDGRPHPSAGQVYVAIAPGGIQTDPHMYDEGRADAYEFTTTLSFRIGQLPVDRWGESSIVLATTGLYDRAHAIAALLHMNYTVMNDANTTIGATYNGFCECPRFSGMGAPQQQNPEWWWAEGQLHEPPVGLSIEIRFGGAKRYQTIASQ